MNLNKNRTGCKNTARTRENINLVLEPLLEDPKNSARKNGLDLSKDTFQRLVKYELEWYPYKMRVRHELLQADYPRRLHFANCFFQRHERFIEDIVIGDEAAFHMNSIVNSHNVRQYSPRYHPPDFHNDLRMSREKVSVGIGIHMQKWNSSGTYFYENTLTGTKYIDLLTERIIPELHQIYPNILIGYGGFKMAPQHMEVVQCENFYKVFSRIELSEFIMQLNGHRDQLT